MNPKADFFFTNDSQWQKEYKKLREIALQTGLQEEVKWGCPCYTYHGKNIFLIHGFKDYCALLFFKGALLNDAENILIQQTENVQAARQIRFSSFPDIIEYENIIKNYMYEAVEIEKSGLDVPLKKTKEFEIAPEFQDELDRNSALKITFESLTPGRQRAYLLHFSSAKQSQTRESRIQKWIPSILKGKGLND
ncbi:YdeI/OmpD-associated family protein [Chryseobacterium sp. CT-SW4]|uniref:YdeI/OmpD-associated family protein n=1 Tax=Chryseobacterium sp. SW-1 TaxID=3157343 RepID=UPI003B0288B7